jgi:hypothetical protein
VTQIEISRPLTRGAVTSELPALNGRSELRARMPPEARKWSDLIAMLPTAPDLDFRINSRVGAVGGSRVLRSAVRADESGERLLGSGAADGCMTEFIGRDRCPERLDRYLRKVLSNPFRGLRWVLCKERT